MRARGKVEELLGKIKDLDGTRDPLGYAKTKTPITLSGSLAKPDPSAYFIQLTADRAMEKLNEAIAPSR